MSGLLRRLTRRRAATADETQPTTPESSEPAAAPAETPAEAAGEPPVAVQPESEQPTRLIPATGEQAAAPSTGDEPSAGAAVPTPGDAPSEPTGDATSAEPAEPTTGDATTAEPTKPTEAGSGGDQTAAAAEQPAHVRDLPAGVDPGELELAPLPSSRRGKLRRRLRYLRRVRELLLRDLGGFSYELHRTAGGVVRESHRRLSETKTSRIAAIDAEIRGLESWLDEPHAEPVLREPGIGGTCPECGELHSSDARYCAHCGAPLDAKARAERDAAIRAAAQPTTGAHPTPEPQPASVLWAAGPHPQASAAQQPEDHSATSEWVTAGGTPAVAPSEAQPQGVEPPQPEAAQPEAGQPVEPVADEAAQPEAGEPVQPEADEAAQPEAGEQAQPEADEATAAEAPQPEAGEQAQPEAARPEEAEAVQPEAGEAGAVEAPRAGEDANGRRVEDVPPPMRPGDPLGSRSEGQS